MIFLGYAHHKPQVRLDEFALGSAGHVFAFQARLQSMPELHLVHAGFGLKFQHLAEAVVQFAIEVKDLLRGQVGVLLQRFSLFDKPLEKLQMLTGLLRRHLQLVLDRPNFVLSGLEFSHQKLQLAGYVVRHVRIEIDVPQALNHMFLAEFHFLLRVLASALRRNHRAKNCVFP